MGKLQVFHQLLAKKGVPKQTIRALELLQWNGEDATARKSTRSSCDSNGGILNRRLSLCSSADLESNESASKAKLEAESQSRKSALCTIVERTVAQARTTKLEKRLK